MLLLGTKLMCCKQLLRLHRLCSLSESSFRFTSTNSRSNKARKFVHVVQNHSNSSMPECLPSRLVLLGDQPKWQLLQIRFFHMLILRTVRTISYPSGRKGSSKTKAAHWWCLCKQEYQSRWLLCVYVCMCLWAMLHRHRFHELLPHGSIRLSSIRCLQNFWLKILSLVIGSVVSRWGWFSGCVLGTHQYYIL